MTIRHAAALLALPAGVALSRPAAAHCDSTRGPVVSAARAALDVGDPSLVLRWVRAEDGAAVRAAFERTREVRALGPEANALADRWFVETLVRMNRAGEGAPYTGLKDGEPEAIIAASDRALGRGTAEEVERHLVLRPADSVRKMAGRSTSELGALGLQTTGKPRAPLP